MTEFFILAMPYAAWFVAGFCLACLVGVIRSGKEIDRNFAEAHRVLDEARAKREANQQN